MLLYVKINRTN